MRTVHLALRVFQGVLSDVEVYDEAVPAKEKVATWNRDGLCDADATYEERDVLTQGTSLRALGLPTLHFNALEHHHIRTVEQLCEMTESRLRRVRYVGPMCIRLVKEALLARGLHLAED